MSESISPTVEFTSVSKEFRHEYIVDKSRFITTISPCTTEEEAQAFIGRINKEFWDATHNCTAYALGPKQEQQRSSDNGEPSGTAGKPMLEVLKKTGITNVARLKTPVAESFSLEGLQDEEFRHGVVRGLDRVLC